MFDPLRIRRNDNRYFSRKGQVLQVKPIVNFPGVFINPNQVQHYKQYIIDNKLITRGEIAQEPLYPNVIKQTFTSDDPITLKDIIDKFPTDCTKLRAVINTSNTLPSMEINQEGQRICMLSGMIIENWLQNPSVGYNTPGNACSNWQWREGGSSLRRLTNLSISSRIVVNWDSEENINAYLDDGDSRCSTNPISGTFYYNNFTLMENRTLDNKATDSYQSFELELGVDWRGDWEKSDGYSIDENPDTILIGSFIGYNNTLNNVTTWQEVTVLQYISYDIYYVPNE